MSTNDRMKTGRLFTPEAASIKVAMVGPVMILAIAGLLAALGVGTFFFPMYDYGSVLTALSPLAITMVLVAAIAYAPLRQIRYRRGVLRDSEAGLYQITVDPAAITVTTKNDISAYDLRDFSTICRDADFLGTGRDFGGLVLARTPHDRPSWTQRASVVNAIRKGRIEPVTHDGITTIPLTYFGKQDCLDIIAMACEYHQQSRKRTE
ncbi:hypothetical protein ROG8370_00569 [Roseovarius gaetbuli]|uniref:Uncharacterized protein n=1 Tax=Roseovarius gaetbuli TaxID=1356575 RepID=A0A1X6YFU4_9RHOB|nr:hypothetical protein [Roseovarius gaetbuli]SLN18188.1 hypothetical protein ROG8370_00569 [Roseovarius gaetbuli]